MKMKSFSPQVLAALRQGLINVVNAAGLILQGEIVRSLKATSTGRNQEAGSTPGNPPATLTGNLSRSIQFSVSERAYGAMGRVSTNAAYAAIHEFGGTISRKSFMLTIPLNDEAREMRRQYRSLRKVKGLQFIPEERLLGRAEGKGKSARFVPLFKLASSVRMPARPYFRPAAARVQRRMRDAIARHISAAVRGRQ